MKKRRYVFTIVMLITLFLVFISMYEKGFKVGTWGKNRSINWK
ncbi:hypothetical protein M2373_004514 [Chryseobacterium sp. JUb7]|nr:hypothetical protein [Chryseobacterium sp. JUb7]